MNKQGHVALGILAGSATLFLPLPFPETNQGLIAKALVVLVTSISALLPDLDHKTSTASQKIQFSAKHRRQFKTAGAVTLLIGIVLLLCQWQWGTGSTWSSVIKTAPYWCAGGILLLSLAHLRAIILSGSGIALMWAYYVYHLQWIAVLVALALFILPLVKHRGIIHTPEFAAVLSFGLLSFAGQENIWIQAILLGVVVGWWAHLAGDIFGTDGIHSLLLPKVGVALRLFSNGGKVERWISKCCWFGSFGIWIFLLQQTFIH